MTRSTLPSCSGLDIDQTKTTNIFLQNKQLVSNNADMDEKQSPLSYQFAMMNVRNSSSTNKAMNSNYNNGDEQNQFDACKSNSKSTIANSKTIQNGDNKMARLKKENEHTSSSKLASPGRRKFTDNVSEDQSKLKYLPINYHSNNDIDDQNIQASDRSGQSSITISLTDNIEQEQRMEQRKTDDNIEPIMDHLDTTQETFSLSSPSPLSSATNTTNEEQNSHYSKNTSINSSFQLHQQEQELKQQQQITNEDVSLKQLPNKRIKKKTTTTTATNSSSNDNKQCCCCNCCQNSQTLSKKKKNIPQESKQTSTTSPNAKWNKQTISPNSKLTDSATLTAATKEPLTQVLITLKDQNKNLIKEIEDLRIKLEDAEGDLKLVQCQMRSMSKQISSNQTGLSNTSRIDNLNKATRNVENENLLNELQFYKEKVIMLENDLRTLLEEKEVLLLSKDNLQIKNEQLNEHLMTMMRYAPLGDRTRIHSNANNPTTAFFNNFDDIYLENKYLKQKIKIVDAERNLLLERFEAYKNMMKQQNSKNNDNLNLIHRHYPQSDEENKLIVSIYNSSMSQPVDNDSSNSLSNIVDNCDIVNDTHHHHHRVFEPFNNQNVVRLSDGHVMDVRNIEQMITYDTIHSMEVNKSNQIYLWRSLLALFQVLQTKNVNLDRARKTNQILGKRIGELELQLGTIGNHRHHQNESTNISNRQTTAVSPINITNASSPSKTTVRNSIDSNSIGFTDPTNNLKLMNNNRKIYNNNNNNDNDGHEEVRRYHHHHGLLPEDLMIISMENCGTIDGSGGDNSGGDTLATMATMATTNKETADPTATATTTTTTTDDDNDEYINLSTPSTTRRSLSIEQQLRALQNEALSITPTIDDTFINDNNALIDQHDANNSITSNLTEKIFNNEYKCDYEIFHDILYPESSLSIDSSTAAAPSTTLTKLYN